MDMKKLERLEAISQLSQRDKKWVHRDIFRTLSNSDLWTVAYENIKGNKGALTTGSRPGTMDVPSIERLHQLQADVSSEKYVFAPVKRILIPRPDGRKRPLGLPTANDKIVQEAMRMILKAIYEPVFSDLSFGFRSGQGCHSALDHVERKFRWVDWVVEGDIQQAYPTIDHTILVQILKKRIDDPRFIRLIRKLLKCGVVDEVRKTYSDTGVRQGSIVSPILANIYYHELDEYVVELAHKFATPLEQITKRRNPEYKALEHKISKLSRIMTVFPQHSKERQQSVKEVKNIRKERFETRSLKDSIIRIEYARYADDWIIGIAGDKDLAIQFKEKVGKFLLNTLKQVIYPLKTKVTDLRKSNVHFLGYDIFLPRNCPISRYKGKGVRTIQRGNPRLRFDVPVARLEQRYIDRGYLKRTAKGVRPISRASYAYLEDQVIVSHYRSVWLGIKNYYSGCTNRGRLQYFHYLLHMSCAMTLGHRHRVSCTKIFKKHGKTLTIQSPDTKRTVSFPYQTTWRLSDKRWLCDSIIIPPTHKYANRLARSSLGLPCIICDSIKGPIEMHHLKHVCKQGHRYGGFHQQIALLNRKQVPMCQACHKKIHAGLYDGPSLTKLRKQFRKEMVKTDI
jgi:group II intron reverse transcriptase/maturase